ncbi:hypothetical protein KR222_001783 [Zaprionus bogoriensis]|nr:hypothetical protein KR222_001783 [Zaprionus bogoriensis]
MDTNDYVSLVLYYGRSSLYNSMQKTALDGLAKFPMQSEFRLFNGIALALGNRMQECIRELNPLKNDLELGLAATMTLVHAHRHCHLVDHDAVQALESRVNEEFNTPGALSYYYAAILLYFVGDFKEALDYITKSIALDNTSDAALVLKIWCELSLSVGGQSLNGRAQSLLEGCIDRSNGKNIDASLALVRFFQRSQQFEASQLVLNKLSIRYPEISIPLVEKMEVQFAALDLDHALDSAIRVINMEPFNITALRTKGTLHIVRESNAKSGALTLHQLLTSVECVEPGNHKLLLEICRLFSRICSRDPETLKLTRQCIEKLNEKNPGNVDLVTELGYEKLLQDTPADAELTFRTACNIDSSNFNALCGLTLCKLKSAADLDSRQQIRQQLAYLTKLSDYRPEQMVVYMSALLADSSEQQSLIEAIELHLRKLDSFPYGVDYICHMNPDFMLEICEALVRYTPAPDHEADCELDFYHESQHATLKHSLSVLETILHVCPGHKGALFMRAKVDFLRGDYTKAISRLQHILGVFGENFTEAHLLMAQILVGKKQYSKAFEYLELAFTHDFTVRERPMYHLLKGIILKNQGNLHEAHQSLVQALQLVGGSVIGIKPHDTTMQRDRTINSSDKMTLYIELIYILRDMGDSQGIHESQRILQFAIEEFSGTTEMGRLVIAHSQLMLEKCDFTKAISLLSTISPDESYYIMVST